MIFFYFFLKAKRIASFTLSTPNHRSAPGLWTVEAILTDWVWECGIHNRLKAREVLCDFRNDCAQNAFCIPFAYYSYTNSASLHNSLGILTANFGVKKDPQEYLLYMCMNIFPPIILMAHVSYAFPNSPPTTFYMVVMNASFSSMWLST